MKGLWRLDISPKVLCPAGGRVAVLGRYALGKPGDCMWPDACYVASGDGNVNIFKVIFKVSPNQVRSSRRPLHHAASKEDGYGQHPHGTSYPPSRYVAKRGICRLPSRQLNPVQDLRIARVSEAIAHARQGSLFNFFPERFHPDHDRRARP